jgi:GNAT superfamily N-acetyltransferase
VAEPPGFDLPVLLDAKHDCAGFDSGEPAFDDWLRDRAGGNMQNGASRTYVTCPAASVSVAGYFSLSLGQILAQETTAAMRRNMPRAIPAVVLGRLAIDHSCQGRGLGRALLAEVILRAIHASAFVAARLVLVHAISPAAEAFYTHYGFTRLPVEAPVLALDLVKFGRV